MALEKSSNARQLHYSGLRIMGQAFIVAIMSEEIGSMLRSSRWPVFLSPLVFFSGLSSLLVYLSLFVHACSSQHLHVTDLTMEQIRNCRPTLEQFFPLIRSEVSSK